MCVNLSAEERKILEKYAKKSNARNVDAYVNALIKSGGYKQIIENAQEKAKKEEEQKRQKEAEQAAEEVELSAAERARIDKQMEQVRKNLGIKEV